MRGVGAGSVDEKRKRAKGPLPFARRSQCSPGRRLRSSLLGCPRIITPYQPRRTGLKGGLSG